MASKNIQDRPKTPKSRSRRNSTKSDYSYSDYSEQLHDSDHSDQSLNDPLLPVFRKKKNKKIQTDKLQWHSVQIDTVKRALTEVIRLEHHTNTSQLDAVTYTLQKIARNFSEIHEFQHSTSLCCFTLVIIILIVLAVVTIWALHILHK